MKDIIKNIENKKELEMNLSQYASGMSTLYNRNSCVRMTLNYYTYSEMLKERSTKTMNKYFDRLNEIIENTIMKDVTSEEYFNKLDELRNEVTKAVDTLTMYADAFALYEHVFNRIEYKFITYEYDKDTMPYDYSKVSDEEITRELMTYIFANEDNVIINQKIAAVIRELPVRMTKNRFFEYLSEGIKIYKGQERQGILDFLYMLRTSAVLKEPVKNEAFEELELIYSDLKKAEFSELTKEDYEKFKGKFAFAVDYLDENVSKFMMLQEIINDLLIILMSNQYVLTKTKEMEALKKILAKVNKLYTEDELDEMDEDFMNIFESLEGVQESVTMKINKYDYMLDTIKETMYDFVEGQPTQHIYDALYRMRKLASDSLFMDLFEEADTKEADEAYINELTNSLIDDYLEAFGSCERIVSRARMAVSLSCLPVFFNNMTELQDYIYESISQCRDEAEKMACKEILLTMVSEEA